MKIKQEHFAHIQSEINAVLAKYPNLVSEYETGKFPRADRVKNLQTRFNHDLLYGAGLTKYVCDNLYSYLNDSHIATALKAICPKVTKKY